MPGSCGPTLCKSTTQYILFDLSKWLNIRWNIKSVYLWFIVSH
jgi:hypothetical protein